jgi:hypothetical protein
MGTWAAAEVAAVDLAAVGAADLATVGAAEVATTTAAVAVATGWAWWWIPAAVAAIVLVALMATATVRVALRLYNAEQVVGEITGVWATVKGIAGFPVAVARDAGHLVAEGSRSAVSAAKKTGGWIAYPFKTVGGWAKAAWAWTRTNPEPHQASDVEAVMSGLEKVLDMGKGVLPAQA